jgi:pimeloyl-ACP methyl ester carboxylesterase
MAAQSTVVEDGVRGVRIEVLVEGNGPDVVLVPSAMRGASDFAMLQAALANAGYRTLAVNPRGAGASTGPFEDITLRDVADDIALVVEDLCDGPVHLVGHALGNTVVRATATYRPEVARSVVVMPCGGHDLGRHPVPPEVTGAVGRCHDETLSVEERLEALRIAFFAAGHDASVWLDGWWPGSAGIGAALARTDPQEWWRGGVTPILIIQPMNDAMAIPAVGREAAAAMGERAEYVEVEECGHAILPEQPEIIAQHVIGFLRAQPPGL